MKCQRDLCKKKKNVQTMNSKMMTNSQLSTTEPKKQTKQTSRTGTESQKWRSQWRVINRGVGGGKWGKRYRE